MTPDMRRALRIARPFVAATLAFIACAPPAAPDDAGARHETCEAACARRVAAHCIEPELVADCVPVCLKLRKLGMTPPERCRP